MIGRIEIYHDGDFNILLNGKELKSFGYEYIIHFKYEDKEDFISKVVTYLSESLKIESSRGWLNGTFIEIWGSELITSWINDFDWEYDGVDLGNHSINIIYDWENTINKDYKDEF